MPVGGLWKLALAQPAKTHFQNLSKFRAGIAGSLGLGAP